VPAAPAAAGPWRAGGTGLDPPAHAPLTQAEQARATALWQATRGAAAAEAWAAVRTTAKGLGLWPDDAAAAAARVAAILAAYAYGALRGP